ncbi:MAG: hypothetical protein LBS53_07865, partial [Synergistaceae bacterium]|nr:hypothetical protein [Synergistaceae bacterium]
MKVIMRGWLGKNREMLVYSFSFIIIILLLLAALLYSWNTSSDEIVRLNELNLSLETAVSQRSRDVDRADAEIASLKDERDSARARIAALSAEGDALSVRAASLDAMLGE